MHTVDELCEMGGMDICGICSAVGEANTFKDVNEADFIILCPDCENKRCANCGLLQSSSRFDDLEYSCPHLDIIEDINTNVCEWYDAECEEYEDEEMSALEVDENEECLDD